MANDTIEKTAQDIEAVTEITKNITTGLGDIFQKTIEEAQKWLSESSTYLQFGVIAGAVFIAVILGAFFRSKIKFFRKENEDSTGFKWLLARTGRLIFPIFLIIFLNISAIISQKLFGTNEVCQGAIRVSIIYLIWISLKAYIRNPIVRKFGLFMLVPVSILALFGFLGVTLEYLDSARLTFGDVDISILMVIKTLISAMLLFWLGRISSTSGQNFIQKQENLEIATKELLTKLFEIVVYFLIFLLLMEIVGIDLTALAIFGGAVGVGLGFGLQNIASNFISGIILLFEKAVTKNDIIQMDDGTFGVVEKVGSRSTVIKTFDGKEVMVPNEDFITSRVTNWSHSSHLVRYEVEFGVTYNADMHLVKKVIEEAVSKHPDIKDEYEYPEVEMREFGDSSVNFGLEFWAEGVDERRGKPSFVSDVMYIIWDTLKEHNIEIPYPQRDLHIIEGKLNKK